MPNPRPFPRVPACEPPATLPEAVRLLAEIADHLAAIRAALTKDEGHDAIR